MFIYFSVKNISYKNVHYINNIAIKIIIKDDEKV